MSNQEPKRRFQGTWAPWQLHDLVKDGILSATAAWLAMNIDSLSRGKSNKRKKCWASNQMLGECVAIKPRQVQILLEQLEESGILRSLFKGKRRFIWIIWDGNSKHKRVDKYKAKNRRAEKCASQENRRAEKCALDAQRNAHNSTTENTSYSHDKSSPSRNAQDVSCDFTCVGDVLLNGEVLINVKPNTTKEDKELARQIRKASTAAKKMKCSGSLATWADCIAKVRRAIGNDVRRLNKVYNWYCKNVSNENYKKPFITHANQISTSIFGWIEEQVTDGKIPNQPIYSKKRVHHPDGTYTTELVEE